MKIKTHLAFLPLVVLAACGGEEKTGTDDKKNTSGDSVQVETKDQATEGYNPEEQLDYEGLENYFNSPRVDEWVKGNPMPESEEMDYVHDYLDAKKMEQLNVRELVYYCTKYPASFSQICADSYQADSTQTPKIVAHFYFDFSAQTMSESQHRALEQRSDSVVTVLKTYMENTPGKLDEDALVLLYELDPVESMPTVIKTLSDQHLVNYTYLMVVMLNQGYQPFVETDMCKKLYGENSWHFSRIEATPENRERIVKLARSFYEDTKNK